MVVLDAGDRAQGVALFEVVRGGDAAGNVALRIVFESVDTNVAARTDRSLTDTKTRTWRDDLVSARLAGPGKFAPGPKGRPPKAYPYFCKSAQRL